MNLIEDLIDQHAPNCHQYSNDEPDLAIAGDAILDAADRLKEAKELLTRPFPELLEDYSEFHHKWMEDRDMWLKKLET